MEASGEQAVHFQRFTCSESDPCDLSPICPDRNRQCTNDQRSFAKGDGAERSRASAAPRRGRQEGKSAGFVGEGGYGEPGSVSDSLYQYGFGSLILKLDMQYGRISPEDVRLGLDLVSIGTSTLQEAFPANI